VEGALFSLIYVLLTRVTTIFGTPALAALAVGHKLEMLNYFVCAGMGAAATTLVGQNLGAGDPRRARRCAWRALYLTALPVGLVTLAMVSFPRAAVRVFIDDRSVLALGVTYVLLVGMSQLFMAAEVVLLGAFAGAQWTGVPVVLEVGLTALRVPLAAWLVERGARRSLRSPSPPCPNPARRAVRVQAQEARVTPHRFRCGFESALPAGAGKHCITLEAMLNTAKATSRASTARPAPRAAEERLRRRSAPRSAG
jgi:hypothetical protein